MFPLRRRRIQLTPVQILPLGFVALILLGTLLLSLPAAAKEQPLTLLQALFTATSASCVTGLTLFDPAAGLSLFGQIVLFLLMQVGGLGFMAFAGVFFLQFRRRMSLADRLTMAESQGAQDTGEVVAITRLTVCFTLLAELCGAALLSIRFIPRFGVARGLWQSLFHSVSAFCNAGFDLLGNGASLAEYRTDPLILCTVMVLIVLGGLGFAVISDLLHRSPGRRLRPYTRLILTGTAVLILLGAGLILLLEWNNADTIASLSPGSKVLNALFASVSLRTGGFSLFPQAALLAPTKLICILWMLIGTASAGTGGGMKIGTVMLLILFVIGTVRGRQDVNLYGRRVSTLQLRRALTVALLFLLCLLVFTILFCIVSPSGDTPLENLIFELSAAFTSGLSVGVTGTANTGGLIILMLAMFIGRVGPLTLVMSLSGKPEDDSIRYPETYIMVG